VDQLYDVANEPHNEETNGDSLRDLEEFYDEPRRPIPFLSGFVQRLMMCIDSLTNSLGPSMRSEK
jgi:hypothetical protein